MAAARGVLKEKPPISAGGDIMVASLPLLAAPNMKPAGSFSSGFPKLNAAGAAASFSVETAAPKLGVGEEEAALVSGPPSLPKTEPAVFSEAPSVDDVFSAAVVGRVKVTEGADAPAVAAVVVVSSGFESPKENPTLGVLASALDAPAPNSVPLLSPNLKPGPPELDSGCLLSVAVESVTAAVPNLKPSVALPNLNPNEALVSFEGVSDVEVPNLKPPVDDEEAESERAAPNLKPAVSAGRESDAADVPNLKPPEPEVPNAAPDEPNEELKPAGGRKQTQKT